MTTKTPTNLTSQTPNPRVVILGGGYAGLLAAGTLRRELPQARITLVDAQPQFSHRVRWHEQLVGQTIDHINYQSFSVERDIEFIQAQVKTLTPSEHQVQLETEYGPTTLAYDQLIYALGSLSRPLWQSPQANCYALNNSHELFKAHAQLAQTKRLLVVGGGLTAVEYATEVAERYPAINVQLVTNSTLLPDYSTAAQDYARRAMADMNIELIENSPIERIEAQQAITASGHSLAFDLCLCSTGFIASPVWQDSGLPTSGNGQIEVNSAMQALGFDNIWVAGDAAYNENNGRASLRMSCATACATSPLIGLNVARAQRGESALEHTPYYFGHCVSLGRQQAFIQIVSSDDRMLPSIVTGTTAIEAKIKIAKAVISTLLWDGEASQADWWPDFEQLKQAAA
mgnify:FL=1